MSVSRARRNRNYRGPMDCASDGRCCVSASGTYTGEHSEEAPVVSRELQFSEPDQYRYVSLNSFLSMEASKSVVSLISSDANRVA